LVDTWVEITQKILDQIKLLEKNKKKDRLELVSSMSIALGGLEMSLRGWNQWIHNPNIMTRFKLEDLRKMNEKLVKFTRDFVEYDLTATKLGMSRGLKARKKTKKKADKPEAYVT
jgi:hypothetical protein